VLSQLIGYGQMCYIVFLLVVQITHLRKSDNEQEFAR